MSATELSDLELVRRLSQAFHEVDRVASMNRPSAARKQAAADAAARFRIELGHRIATGTFTAWHRLGVTDSADDSQRRESGSGTVYYDNSRERWVAELTLNGKRHRKVLKEQDAAETWLRSARQRLEEGRDADAPTWTVEPWLTRCIGELWPVSLSEKTLALHQAAADRWWVPNLGSRRLESLTPSDITGVVKLMAADGLSPNSIRINTATMGKAMKEAMTDGIVPRNVVSLAQRPKIETTRPALSLTVEQARRTLEIAADEHHGDAVALALWIALRRGEVLGLSWEAVDLDAQTAVIGAQLVRKPDNSVELKAHVKGGRSKARTVPLPAGAVEVLRRRKQRQAEERLAAGAAWKGGTPGTSGLVFTDGLGGPVHPDHFGRAVRKVTEQAGQKVHPHALRHSTISLLAHLGVPMKVAQVIAGHSTIAMTSDVYTHVMGDDMKQAAAILDSALRDAN